MSTTTQQQPASDHGEPWSEQTAAMNNGVHWLNTEQFNRAVVCVNACAGMDDPAKEIAAMREAINAGLIALFRYDVEDVDLEGSEELTITVTEEDQKLLRAAIAKLQPFIKP